MATPTQIKMRGRLGLILGTIVAALTLVAVTYADNVVNDVDAAVGATFAAGGSTSASYWIVSNNGDGHTGCNAADSSKATVQINAPAGVAVNPSSLEFTACDRANAQSVTFSSNTAGDYSITASVSDSGAGTYNTNPAAFTLHVTGGGGGGVTDTDGDGVADSSDNCPNNANSDQADADSDGLGNACDSNSYAPTVATAAADVTNGVEGSAMNTSGAFSDQDGIDGTHPLTITTQSGLGTVTDNGDGTWSWSYTSADNASGSVTVQASDGEHALASDMFTWTAVNAEPVVGALAIGGGGTACLAGNHVTLDFSFSDAGVNDNPWTVSINWGDGSTPTSYNASSQGAQAQQSHTYLSAGSFNVAVTVTDKDGGSNVSTNGTGSVSLLYNMSGIQPPINADGTSIFKYGSTIPVKVRITDCLGNPVPGLAPTIGLGLANSATPPPAINEDVYSTSAADTGNVMRYDASAGQYIYNFNTKSAAVTDQNATYWMTVRSTVTSPSQVASKFGLKSK